MQEAKSPPRSHKNALKSAHFVLSALPSAATGSNVVVSVRNTPAKEGTLFMAIPKRLLKRAVDRNAVKRICREAWRLKYAKTSDVFIESAGNSHLALTPPKLIKLVSIPSFETIKQLKYVMRADVDVLFAKLK